MKIGKIRNATSKALFRGSIAFSRRPRLDWIRKLPADPQALTLITVAFSNPLAIDVQAQLLRDRLLDPYRHVVVDNSPSVVGRAEIADVCRRRQIEYFRLPRSPYTGRDPSFSHAEALNYTVRNLPGLNKAVAVGFMDHDVFLGSHLSVMGLLGRARGYGRPQSWEGRTFLWPGLAIYRSDSVAVRSLDFRPVRGRGDTGARTFRLLDSWGPDDTIFTSESRESVTIKGVEYLFERHDAWIHTLSASGWRGIGTERNDLVAAIRTWDRQD